MNSVEIQTIFASAGQPDEQQIQLWIDTALENSEQDTEIVVRIVDEQESAELNQQYRHKQGATNILSFPVELPEGIDLDLNLLGYDHLDDREADEMESKEIALLQTLNIPNPYQQVTER